MASITFDGQSFLVDGRRIWLVGGTIQYARLTRAEWPAAIHAAKVAGLNMITTSVVWARHEPRAGQFDFTGDNDLRHFVSLIKAAGMYCVIRLGPFVDGSFDFGGMPPWVLSLKDGKVRTQNQPFLEAASRFIGAVAKQVKDLQITVPQHEGDTQGGPIVMVQNEHGWHTGSDFLTHGYLAELYRYIHESGFEVPVVNANNLWAGVEGEIDGWVGSANMISTVRQMATVRPDQPRLIVRYDLGEPSAWGEDAKPAFDETGLLRGLCEITAGGGQFNIEPMVGGTNFAFSGGRLSDGASRFAVSAIDPSAPVDAAGRRGALFAPLRKAAMFASQFGRVLSHLDVRHPGVSLHPAVGVRGKRGKSVETLSVLHAAGSQGNIAFIFRGGDLEEPANPSLLLADGTTLPVPMGTSPVAWCLMDTRLHGRSTLDYCNLSAFALVGRVFVVFGPAGSRAVLSINGSPAEAEVPSGETPSILEHENMVVVIAGEHQLERIQVTDDAVYLNAVDVSSLGGPVVDDAKDVVTRLLASGEIIKSKFGEKPAAPPAPPPPPVVDPKAKKVPLKKGAQPPAPPAPPPPPQRPPVVVREMVKTPRNPEFQGWTGTDLSDYVTGTSPRFASIDGPTDLASLGAPYGYGWYKITLKERSASRVDATWPQSGDRLHLYTDGKFVGLMGRGPGAKQEMGLTVKKGEHTLVVLAENLGRFSGGAHLNDHKGVFGHLFEVSPARIGRATLVNAEGINPMSPVAPPGPHHHPTPYPGVHEGDVTDPFRITWTFGKHRHPLVMRLPAMGLRGLVLVNGTVSGYFDDAGPETVLIDEDRVQRQTNTIELATLRADAEAALKIVNDGVTFHDVHALVTGEAEWAFAKWERPGESAFHALRGHAHGKGPEWFRTTFNVPNVPPVGGGVALYFVTTGLSKGQLYVNGKHVGRYFTATADNHAVGPQTELRIPSSVLRAGEGNELMIFDEHGHLPSRTRLAWRD